MVAKWIPGRIESEYKGSIFHRGCKPFEFFTPVEDDVNLRIRLLVLVLVRFGHA